MFCLGYQSRTMRNSISERPVPGGGHEVVTLIISTPIKRGSGLADATIVGRLKSTIPFEQTNQSLASSLLTNEKVFTAEPPARVSIGLSNPLTHPVLWTACSPLLRRSTNPESMRQSSSDGPVAPRCSRRIGERYTKSTHSEGSRASRITGQ